MTDHDALLQAVLAAPEDDLPRLVFADFLEESGHPANVARAQFIRLQIEAEGSSRKEELLAKAEELRPMFRDELEATLPAGFEGRWVVTHRRGFVDNAEMIFFELMAYGRWICGLVPITSLAIPGVTLRDGQAWVQFQEYSYLSRVTSLRLGPRLLELQSNYRNLDGAMSYRPATTALLDNSHLIRLLRLEVSDNQLDDEWVVIFVSGFGEASFSDTLRELDLSNNLISDAGANTLAAGRGLDGLTLLDLRDNRLTADGIAMLRRRFGERVVV